MTRDQAKNIWEVIKAYGEGKDIQWRVKGNSDWIDSKNELGFLFDSDRCEYRIKPEKITIEFDKPADNILRCWKCGKELNTGNMSNVIYHSNPPRYTCKECEKQTDVNDKTGYEPFSSCSDLIDFCGTKLIYVINKKYKTEILITGFEDEVQPSRVLLFGDMWMTLNELFENYTFCDGHPCGKIIKLRNIDKAQKELENSL